MEIMITIYSKSSNNELNIENSQFHQGILSFKSMEYIRGCYSTLNLELTILITLG